MKITKIAVLLAVSGFVVASNVSVFGQDAAAVKAELQQSVKTPEVQEELDEPDGASIEWREDGGYRIFGRGSAVYDFNDSDDKKDARAEAELDAKAKIVKFLNERITSEEVINKLTEKRRKQVKGEDGVETKEATKETVKSTVKSLSSQASAVVKGIVVLESRNVPNTNGDEGGEFRITVGLSSKTEAMANRVGDALRKSTKNSPSQGLNSSGESSGSSGGAENKEWRRKSSTDF